MNPVLLYAIEGIAGLGLGIGIMHYFERHGKKHEAMDLEGVHYEDISEPYEDIIEDREEILKELMTIGEEMVGEIESEDLEGGIVKISEKYGLSGIAIASGDGGVIASSSPESYKDAKLSTLLFQSIKTQFTEVPSTVSVKTDQWEYVIPFAIDEKLLFSIVKSLTSLTDVERDAIIKDVESIVKKFGA